MDWAKTTARRDEKHLNVWIWCDLYYMFNGILHLDILQKSFETLEYDSKAYLTDDFFVRDSDSVEKSFFMPTSNICQSYGYIFCTCQDRKATVPYARSLAIYLISVPIKTNNPPKTNKQTNKSKNKQKQTKTKQNNNNNKTTAIKHNKTNKQK